MNRNIPIRCVCALLAALATAGCQRQHSENAAYHLDGRAKPVVALLPMQDRSGDQVCWDLGQELYVEVRDQLQKQGELFLAREQAPSSDLPFHAFGHDLSWAKRYAPAEYVLAVELVEHKRDLIDPSKARSLRHQEPLSGYAVQIKARVRLVDIRGAEPALAYQELVNQRHLAPTNEARTDFMTVGYGTPSFERSALAKAHRKLVQRIAERVQHYATIQHAKAPR